MKAYDKSKRDSTNLQDQTFDTSKNGRALGNMNSLHSHGDQEHWLGYDYGLLDEKDKKDYEQNEANVDIIDNIKNLKDFDASGLLRLAGTQELVKSTERTTHRRMSAQMRRKTVKYEGPEFGSIGKKAVGPLDGNPVNEEPRQIDFKGRRSSRVGTVVNSSPRRMSGQGGLG